MSWSKPDEQAFVQILFAMGELFETPVSAMRAEMFCRGVEDLPFAAVKAAAAAHVRWSKFFPKPADLREHVEGNIGDQAEEAWRWLQREVRRVGYTGAPSWPDVLTRHAAEGLFGSWRSLCERLPADGPELLGFRKQFLALYGAGARRAQLDALPPSRDEARERLEELRRELKARDELATGKER